MPLSGFFLILIGIGGAGASLFAIGYGRHEAHPERILPFYPAFLAGMILVIVADDAFTFLFAWELMSLTSWALVMAHHRQPGNARAGFVYLIMATFSGLALLLAFGLLAGPQGDYAFDTIRAHHPERRHRRRDPDRRPDRRRIESRPRAAARLAAAGAPRGAQPRLRPHERRHDQDRHLRLHPHRLRPARPQPAGGPAPSCSHWAG